MIPHTVPTAALLAVVRDGDEHGWETEFDYLWDEHADSMAQLTEDIRANGIQNPIMVGGDGRVWDGHHRLAAAYRLMLPTVPVTWSGETDD